VQGLIEILFRAGTFSPRAEIRMRLTRAIFSDGYVAPLRAAVATVSVAVERHSDLLLDDGSQFEMMLEQPVLLNATRVAAAARVSRRSAPPGVRSATRCRPTVPVAGTPDTVIPGTPGTAPVVIPSGTDSPPLIIPGTPETGPTVIPGTPSSAVESCPAPPTILTAPFHHKEALVLQQAIQHAGRALPPGTYDAAWDGLAPTTDVSIYRRGKLVVRAAAQIEPIGRNASASHTTLSYRADGTAALHTVQFKDRNFALRFDP
jgi:hypothetical protein